jgi:hypothetical protein
MSDDFTVTGDELDRCLDRAERAEALLRDVAASAVTFDDPRVGYVEVQIDRPTWAAIRVQKDSPA